MKSHSHVENIITNMLKKIEGCVVKYGGSLEM
jgi:hypothetical protein